MKTPYTYEVDEKGFTADGLFLGISKGPYKPLPDVFQHPGPLPKLSTKTVRALSPLGDHTRPTCTHQIASLDESHAEDMRRYYGDANPDNDGARITWATPVEHVEPTVEKKTPTAEEIARMHGESELRRIRGQRGK
jgi:hypothetical protein